MLGNVSETFGEKSYQASASCTLITNGGNVAFVIHYVLKKGRLREEEREKDAQLIADR